MMHIIKCWALCCCVTSFSAVARDAILTFFTAINFPFDFSTALYTAPCPPSPIFSFSSMSKLSPVQFQYTEPFNNQYVYENDLPSLLDDNA